MRYKKYKQIGLERYFYVYKSLEIVNEVVPFIGNAILIKQKADEQKISPEAVIDGIFRCLAQDLLESLHSLLVSADLWYIEMSVLPTVYENGVPHYLDVERLEQHLFEEYGLILQLNKTRNVTSLITEEGREPIIIIKSLNVLAVTSEPDHQCAPKTYLS